MESLQQKIQQRAYDLFLQRGGQPGHAMEDWVKAEKEIKTTNETKQSHGHPAEAPVIENKNQPQPIQKEGPYPAKKVERKYQSINSRN
jgi:Protein of unknown function (DUF2934)